MIFVDIGPLQIIQKLTSSRDHFEQAAAGVVILFVNLEMLRQFVDALGEQRDLYLRRTSIRTMRLEISNYLFL